MYYPYIAMADQKLSYTAALLLQTISARYKYGFDKMDITALPSGTVYPTLRRLEQQDLIKSNWETEDTAFADQRPARKYYQLTREGRESLDKAIRRYTRIDQLSTSEKDSRD